MKRFRLSAKLAMAIIPIGLVALLAAGFIAVSFLDESKEQNETAHAATVSADAIDTLKAVWEEEGQARQLFLFEDEGARDDLVSAAERTDEAYEGLKESVRELRDASDGFFGGVATSIAEDVRNVGIQLDQVRANQSSSDLGAKGYQDLANSILSVLPKASSIVSDRIQARELSTAYFLAEGGQVSLLQEQLIEQFRASVGPDSPTESTVSERNALQSTLEVLESDFGAWALRANQTANQMNAAILRYTRLPEVNIDTFPLARNEDILRTSENLAQGVADESQANAVESETEAYLVAGVAAIILLIALWGSYAVIRSVVRRVRGVTSAAVHVSEVDLPNLVEALQNPREDIADLRPTVIASAGKDEVGDLAQSFTSLHSTLIDVAGQQMEILRKGVSEIFVTLARRNRSLVDRQLALLDELESREEDPETLGGYYSLDHLATRMRRNAESLLVLAGSEPTRIWANPLEVSEIIRAALGEVDEYQRVDIMALEPVMVSGRAVADIAHLMSELLDNGTQYSSPSDRVRVAGLFDPEGYMLTVSDSGIGMTEARLAELNGLLESPPVLGLALQPTLGMYVVARLAARHGVKVQLISGSPGLTIRVLLPKSLIEPAQPKDEPAPAKPLSEARETTEFRPALDRSTPAGGSPNGLAAAAIADSVDEFDEGVDSADRPSGLPGSVKGKHEHPGRKKALSSLTDEEFASLSGEVSDTTEVEAIPDEPVSPFTGERPDHGTPDYIDPFGGARDPVEVEPLSKRVPGEALKAEEGATEIEEFSPDHQSLDRIDERDDSPWWTKEVPKSEPEPVDPNFVLWDSEVDEEEAPDIPEVPESIEDTTRMSDAGLPVRTPGVSFRETDESDISSAASESGAIGIRSALSSFATGRELAIGQSDSEIEEDEDRPAGSEE